MPHWCTNVPNFNYFSLDYAVHLFDFCMVHAFVSEEIMCSLSYKPTSGNYLKRVSKSRHYSLDCKHQLLWKYLFQLMLSNYNCIFLSFKIFNFECLFTYCRCKNDAHAVQENHKKEHLWYWLRLHRAVNLISNVWT